MSLIRIRCLSGLVKQNLGKRRIDLTLRRKLNVQNLPSNLREFVEKSAKLCQPSDIHVVDGSEEENKNILEKLVKDKTVVPVKKYKNSYLARTDPRDVARVESKTFICTKCKHDTVPRGKSVSQLGNWMSEEDMDKAVNDRFPGSMKDRTMYVIPFSMGPVGGPMSKLCLQLTDSAYVVASTRIMTRMGEDAFDLMRKNEGKGVVRALHSVGRSSGSSKSWPCDPERTLILHKPADQLIFSYGSGYGGNSLLGKKCLALRLGSSMAKEEGWLAEHMLILGIQAPDKPKRYIAAAFPSACGKTNLAMLKSSLPGYKVETVGDDIAWIKHNSRTGMLHAINPEFGFFGVAPGTSWKTNPNAMATLTRNSLFTNVAETSDGGVWWEGMEKPAEGVQIIDWHGNEWKDGNAAHPNSRFTAPAGQCPCMDPAWEDPEGVPLSAILFGGRRPQGVPLVYESFNWEHGVFLGAAMRSEATAAAEHKGKVIMHDPFAMRPFFGYNAGHYMEHWLSINDRHKSATLPKIFHVNWFRKGSDGKFLWPGFGENIRVIDWILKRVDGGGEAQKTPIGYIPTNSLNTEGLVPKPNMEELLSVPNEFWKKEAEEIQKYFDEQLGEDLPKRIKDQLLQLKNRLKN